MAVSGIVNLVATAKSNGLDIGLQWQNNGLYDKIWLQKDEGSGWVTISDELEGGVETYTDADVTQNVRIYYRAAGFDGFAETWTEWSNTDGAGSYLDTFTDALTVTDSISEVAITGDIFLDTFSMSDILDEKGVYADTFTDAFSMGDGGTGRYTGGTGGDYLSDAQSIKTNYAYYLGVSTGDVYEYSGDYKGYAGNPIGSRWESKDIDFSDQLPRLRGFFKTIYGARLYYVDLDADTQVGVGYSTDGGATWKMETKTIGAGGGVFNTVDFHFMVTTYNLRIAIVHSSADKRFQWTGIKLFCDEAGEFFEV